jgi:hypothetical protein
MKFQLLSEGDCQDLWYSSSLIPFENFTEFHSHLIEKLAVEIAN